MTCIRSLAPTLGAALLLGGCAADTWQRAGYGWLAARACADERPPRADCHRAYGEEYRHYQDERARTRAR